MLIVLIRNEHAREVQRWVLLRHNYFWYLESKIPRYHARIPLAQHGVFGLFLFRNTRNVLQTTTATAIVTLTTATNVKDNRDSTSNKHNY